MGGSQNPEGTHMDKGRICNLQTEEPLPPGIRTWSLEFIHRTLKIQNTQQQFARACVEKLQERVATFRSRREDQTAFQLSLSPLNKRQNIHKSQR